MRLIAPFLLCLASLSAPAFAQTVTVTAPNTVNPSGQPKAVASTFIVNADGSIATVGGTAGTVAAPSSMVTTVQGTAANGATPAGNPVLMSGSDGTTNRTIRTDNAGIVQMSVANAAAVVPASDATASTFSGMRVVNYGLVFNGSTWDRQRGDVQGTWLNTAPSAASAVGIVPVVGSAVSAITGKAAAGNLYSVSITTGAAAVYLYVFNATAAPADGAVVAGTGAGQYQFCTTVAATTTMTSSFDVPERYSTGIIPVVSSTACGTLTKTATAVFMKARVQ